MIAAAVLLVALVWVYGRVAWGLAAEWASSPDASYGAVLAAAAAYVFWQRRRAFVQALDRSAPSVLSAAALTCSLSLFVVGQLSADVFLTRASLVFALASGLWFLAGARAVRALAAPLAFLAMAVPLPALIVNAVTLPLQLVASRIAESTLMASGVPVFRDGNLLTLQSGTLEVAEACSGLRSLVSLVALGGLIAWAADARLAKRAVLVALAVPIAIVMNGLRIAATGVACETFGPRAAAGAWHTFTGWLTFVASVGALAVAQRAITASRAAPMAEALRERGVVPL